MNQGVTFEEYLRLDFNPVDSGNYTINVPYQWSMNSLVNDLTVFISVYETAGDILVKQIYKMIAEPQDIGGTGEVVNVLSGGVIVGLANTGTNQRYNEIALGDVVLTGGTDYYCTMTWASSSTNSEATIYNAQMSVTKNKITNV